MRASLSPRAAPMIPAADRWCPFAEGIDPPERLSRLRSHRAIAHLYLGLRGDAFVVALRRSKRESDHMLAGLRHLDALAPLDRWAVLASFARIQ